MSDPVNLAINAALTGNWNAAVELNLNILKENKNNLDALNRLARAYLELGKSTKAKETLKYILKNIDPYNGIANKNLDRLEKGVTKKKYPVSDGNGLHMALPTSFIEEPGKTKTVSLINLASPKVISDLYCSQPVLLMAKHHSIHVSDLQGNYLGAFPDDIGKRLNTLINGGNTYEACIKSLAGNITIFVRELTKTKKFAHIPSFYGTSNEHQEFNFEGEDELVIEDQPVKTTKVTASPQDNDDDEEGLPGALAVIHQDEESEESQ